MDLRDGLRFTEAMIKLNGLAGFSRWVLFSGMAFEEENLWWGACRKRLSSHEGIDLCAWEDAAGGIGRLRGGAVVPAMAEGVVRHVEPDFLGHSIWVDLGRKEGGGGTLHAVYAHVVPAEGIRSGRAVAAGEPLAAVAAVGKVIPDHLHLSLAWVPERMPKEMFAWEKLVEGGVRFVDPLPCFEGNYRLGAEGEKPW